MQQIGQKLHFGESSPLANDNKPLITVGHKIPRQTVVFFSPLLETDQTHNVLIRITTVLKRLGHVLFFMLFSVQYILFPRNYRTVPLDLPGT